MTPNEAYRPQMDRFQRNALIVGVIALAVSVLGLVQNATHFWQSYLFGFIFWAGLALGCLGIFFLHNVVGGNWGVAIRRFIEAGVRTLPLVALAAIPVLFAVKMLYSWTNPEVRAHDFAVGHKAVYMNVPFFIARTVLYFLIWFFFGYRILRMANEHDRTGDPALFKKIKGASAPALLIFVVSTTYAFIDWIMSLEPDWYSTIYPWMFTVGQVVLTFAFMISLLVLLSRREPFIGFLKPAHYHDLGNLLLAFTMVWAYMSFAQLLIIWAENLPDEIPWYIRRFSGGWGYLAWFISIFHFCIPFFLLLMRFIKRNANFLRTLAIWIIIVRIVDVFWIVEPAFRQHGLEVYWTDLAVLIGLGGVWLWAFVGNLKARPLLVPSDPRNTYSRVQVRAH
ncbi:MAG TPA: hypothetical protein VMH05_18895 [Bryobacteraceae bacterium]|nr:hypothetical protein [Bryobacteraceae bacterium]